MFCDRPGSLKLDATTGAVNLDTTLSDTAVKLAYSCESITDGSHRFTFEFSGGTPYGVGVSQTRSSKHAIPYSSTVEGNDGYGDGFRLMTRTGRMHLGRVGNSASDAVILLDWNHDTFYDGDTIKMTFNFDWGSENSDGVKPGYLRTYQNGVHVQSTSLGIGDFGHTSADKPWYFVVAFDANSTVGTSVKLTHW